MKNNKKIIWFLSIVLLLIWGAIGYQIITGIFQSNNNDAATIINNEAGKNLNSAKYQYIADVRDPFRFHIPSNNSINTPNTKQVLPVWVPPTFRLTGILVNKNKRTALLEGQDGSVSFLQEGDSVAGIRILKIKEKLVVYSFQKRKGEWAL
jgi:hypothetical protein